MNSIVQTPQINLNLPKETFLHLLSLERKIEKQVTKERMNKLVVVYTKLVEHYNMKQDPIYIYFLEKIKIALSRIAAFKLYYTDPVGENMSIGSTQFVINKDQQVPQGQSNNSLIAEEMLLSQLHHQNQQNNINPKGSLLQNNNENILNNSQIIDCNNSYQVKMMMQQSQQFCWYGDSVQFGNPKDSFDNLLDFKQVNVNNKGKKVHSHQGIYEKRVKRQKLYAEQQQSNGEEKDEEYDLEKMRNERNIKLSVFKEVVAHAQGKHSDVKQLLTQHEQQSNFKDGIVQNDIESQMDMMNRRIQRKKETMLKKSAHQEFNNPRENRAVTCENNYSKSKQCGESGGIMTRSKDNKNIQQIQKELLVSIFPNDSKSKSEPVSPSESSSDEEYQSAIKQPSEIKEAQFQEEQSFQEDQIILTSRMEKTNLNDYHQSINNNNSSSVCEQPFNLNDISSTQF